MKVDADGRVLTFGQGRKPLSEEIIEARAAFKKFDKELHINPYPVLMEILDENHKLREALKFYTFGEQGQIARTALEAHPQLTDKDCGIVPDYE